MVEEGMKKEGLYQKNLRIEVDTDSLFYGA